LKLIHNYNLMLKDFFVETRYQSTWRIIFWLVLLLLLGLTLTPQLPNTALSIQHIDKLFHLIAFAGFSFIFCMAFAGISFKWAILLSTLLGIGIEVAQHYIPNRGFSLWDMLADFLGILLGCFLIRQLRTYH